MFQVLLFILGAVDVFVGLILAFHPAFISSSIFLYLGVFMLVKGGWSIITGVAQKFYFDFLGAIDVFAGVMLLLISYGIIFNSPQIVGIIVILKGIWSAIFSM